MRRSTLALRTAGSIAGLSILAFAHALAQSSGPVKPWERPQPPTGNPTVPGTQPPMVPGAPSQTQPPQQAPPQIEAQQAQAEAQVIARVQGRPITQRDYDRLAEPYFDRLKTQLGSAFSGDLKKTAVHNVLDELIRRELLVIEAQRQKLEVSESDIDQILAADPFFATNGKFDPAKLAQFKLSPQSNYHVILPRLRDVALAEKMDKRVRASLAPPPALVRVEWSKRNEQVRFKFLPLTTRDVSLDAETDEQEQLAYYKAHPDQFEKKARLNLRYVRLSLAAEGDSLRAAQEKQQLERARGIADSLHKGTSLDTLAAPFGGASETGLFELPATSVPGLGSPQAILDRLERAVSDTTLVLGPAVTPGGVVVAKVSGHEAKRMPSFSEARGEVKRRADAEKRRTQLEADKQAYYDKHRGDFRTVRTSMTRAVLNPAMVAVKAPSSVEIEHWYTEHAKDLFAGDSALTKNPPSLTDSLRGLARARLTDDAKSARAGASMTRLVTAFHQNAKSLGALARAEGARIDTLSLTKDSPRDSLFPPTLVDSLLEPTTRAGEVRGPRSFGPYDVAWRVDAVDTAFVPSFEAARSRVERAFQEQRRQEDEDSAKVYFAAHRGDYKTKPKWVIDYVQVRIAPPDSVKVANAELRKFWEQHKNDRFKREEEVRARHILIATKPNATPAEEAKAKARADSLRKAMMKGADFAELAKKFSQDPGSGVEGGDLGFFGRGRMVKEFNDTSFALPVGRVSQPVKTQFGWHLIKVEEKRPAGVRPFSEVEQQIRAELSRQRADSLALRSAKRMLRQIAAVGALAATKSVGGVQTSAPIAATDPVPGVGIVPDLGADLERLPLGAWSNKPYKEASSYVLVRPQKRVAVTQAEFDEVKRQAVDDMKNAKKKALIAKKLADVRAQLKAGASLDSAAAIFGGVKDSGPLTRMGGFVPLLGSEPRVLEKAFAMKPGVTSDTIQVAQGVVWIKPEEKKTLEGMSFAKQKDAITNELLAKNLEDWVEKKKKTVRIEVLRADLREPPPPKFKTVTTTLAGQ